MAEIRLHRVVVTLATQLQELHHQRYDAELLDIPLNVQEQEAILFFRGLDLADKRPEMRSQFVHELPARHRTEQAHERVLDYPSPALQQQIGEVQSVFQHISVGPAGHHQSHNDPHGAQFVESHLHANQLVARRRIRYGHVRALTAAAALRVR